MKDMSLQQQTFHGIKWLVGSSFVQKVLSFATTIVLARVLGPSVFGLFAYAMIVITAFELFKSMGVDSALIRWKEDIALAADTAFIVILLTAIVLYLILLFSAPVIGSLLNDQSLVAVVKVLGIGFVVRSFARVPTTLLERDMQFKVISLSELISAVIYCAVAITLTFLRFGVWGLVYAYLLKTLAAAVIVWYYARWKPSWRFDRRIAREMIHFGKYILLSSVVWFCRMNLDNLLVGKLLGVTTLGLYAIAFNIANFGADYIGNHIHRVTYPVYSQMKEDIPRLRSAYVQMLKHMSLFALPFGVGLVLLGKEFLLLAYGPKWEGAASALQLLAVAGMANTLPANAAALLMACGKPRLLLYITLIQIVFFILLIIPLAKLGGLIWVSAVVAVTSAGACVVAFAYVGNILHLRAADFFESMKVSLKAVSFMAAGIMGGKYVLGAWNNNFMLKYQFIILFTMAVLIYGYTLFRIDKTLFAKIREMLR